MRNSDNFTSSRKNLSQCVVRSSFWMFLLRTMQQFLNLARLMVLARILAPEDFGIMGIALLSMSILELFSQTGFQSALIQKKGDISSYLNSTWTALIFRGLILFIILYSLAPYFATFYNEPDAKTIIQIIGFSVIFQAFTNIGVIYLKKDLEFNKQFFYELSGTLAEFFVAIVSSLILRNVWALVLGLLARNALMLITSYLIHPYRPRLSFDIGKTKELYVFGRWIFASSILYFLISQGDNILVGKILGASALGFYQMAYTISNLPATEITNAISQVLFPFYSKLQDDIPKMREAYLRILQFTSFISFPFACFIFTLAPNFITIFLGEKWIPIVPAIEVLAFAGLVRSIAETASPIFYAVGKPSIDSKFQMARLFAMVIFIYPFTIKLGIQGTSIAVFLSISIATIGCIFNVIKVTGCRVKDFIKSLVFPLIMGIIMVATILTIKNNSNITGILGFISLIGAGLFVFLGMTYLFDKYLNYGIGKLIMESLNSFRAGL